LVSSAGWDLGHELVAGRAMAPAWVIAGFGGLPQSIDYVLGNLVAKQGNGR